MKFFFIALAIFFAISLNSGKKIQSTRSPLPDPASRPHFYGSRPRFRSPHEYRRYQWNNQFRQSKIQTTTTTTTSIPPISIIPTSLPDREQFSSSYSPPFGKYIQANFSPTSLFSTSSLPTSPIDISQLIKKSTSHLTQVVTFQSSKTTNSPSSLSTSQLSNTQNTSSQANPNLNQKTTVVINSSSAPRTTTVSLHLSNPWQRKQFQFQQSLNTSPTPHLLNNPSPTPLLTSDSSPTSNKQNDSFSTKIPLMLNETILENNLSSSTTLTTSSLKTSPSPNLYQLITQRPLKPWEKLRYEQTKTALKSYVKAKISLKQRIKSHIFEISLGVLATSLVILLWAIITLIQECYLRPIFNLNEVDLAQPDNNNNLSSSQSAESNQIEPSNYIELNTLSHKKESNYTEPDNIIPVSKHPQHKTPLSPQRDSIPLDFAPGFHPMRTRSSKNLNTPKIQAEKDHTSTENLNTPVKESLKYVCPPPVFEFDERLR